jgi:hypothetical protein
LRPKDYKKYKEFEKELNKSGSNEEERRWKEFLKLARFFGEVPDGKRLFSGWLHDCEATALTDSCSQPIIDKDRWMQYCFTQSADLGDALLFIELNVDWNEWIVADVKETSIVGECLENQQSRPFQSSQ